MVRSDSIRSLLILVAVLPAAGATDNTWVFFRDKPAGDSRISWRSPEELQNNPELSAEIDPEYTRRVLSHGVVLRSCSRWFNAVSVSGTQQQLQRLADLPFVVETRRVKHLAKPPPIMQEKGLVPAAKISLTDYGPSFEQLSNIGVIELHNLGYMGDGIRIAILDAGYPYRDHLAFAQLTVIAERNFVDGNAFTDAPSEQPASEEAERQSNHGTRVLSIMAAFDQGGMIGVAPRAHYLLATTEDITREVPAEEDLWVTGLEWADSLGADIVNSSVGYNEWDEGGGYTYGDLDGSTAVSTIAAEIAIARGIVIVAAAGNEATLPWHYITVPADGPNVIAVGAVGLTQPVIAPFSSRGPTADGRLKPDVVAPGVSVITADTARTSAGDGKRAGYRRMRGTSFAAPLVSGVSALLREIHPTWTPNQVAEALRTTARDLGDAGPDTTYGWGLVNAVAASGIDLELPATSLALVPFPNPLRQQGEGAPAVYFPLQLAARDEISLRVYAIGGTLVHEMAARQMEAGDYIDRERALRWVTPAHLAAGVYFYSLQGRSFSKAGKIALIGER